MTQLLRYEFILFGPRKNQTIMINGHPFDKGVCKMVLDGTAAGTVMRGLSYYGAYAKGTPAYDEAMEAENGIPGPIQAGLEQAPKQEVRDFDGPTGNPAAEESPPVSEGPVGDDAGHRDSPSGDGHEDAGVHKFENEGDRVWPGEPQSAVNEAVKTAVLALDPQNDNHWTKAGIPALLAVEESMGRAGATRQDVVDAVPGWDRDAARTARTPDPSEENRVEF